MTVVDKSNLYLSASIRENTGLGAPPNDLKFYLNKNCKPKLSIHFGIDFHRFAFNIRHHLFLKNSWRRQNFSRKTKIEMT